jgi:hypothetical protein
MSIGHPMEVPCIPTLLNIHSCIELNNHFIVLIFLECYDIPQVFGSASSHKIIKNQIMLLFHIAPINPLRDGYWLALWNDHTLIEILLKPSVKHVVISIPREKSLILPPCWIFFGGGGGGAHVHMGLR